MILISPELKHGIYKQLVNNKHIIGSMCSQERVMHVWNYLQCLGTGCYFCQLIRAHKDFLEALPHLHRFTCNFSDSCLMLRSIKGGET